MYFSHATTGLLQSVLARGESPLEMRFSYLPSHLTRYQVQGQYDVLFPSSRPACIWRCAPLFPFHWLTKLYFAACTMHVEMRFSYLTSYQVPDVLFPRCRPAQAAAAAACTWRCLPLTLPENFTKKKLVFLFVSP